MSVILTTREKEDFQGFAPEILRRGVQRAIALCFVQNDDFGEYGGSLYKVPFYLSEDGEGIIFVFDKRTKVKRKRFNVFLSYRVMAMDDIIFQEFLESEKKLGKDVENETSSVRRAA